jgi:hypothetical protein
LLLKQQKKFLFIFLDLPAALPYTQEVFNFPNAQHAANGRVTAGA